MTDPRFDFSSIDPSRDRTRWEQRIAELATQAAAAAQARRTVSAQLATWLKPALALAAGIALALWLAAPPSLTSRPSRELAQGQDPAFALQYWALGDNNHTAWKQLEALGVDHEQW
ncbi:MAG: hypothetical protein IPL40_14785 [Proteobacteria bacterium]|nr:hypothetical protein [Pseudomonadota bacterium]